MTKAVTVRLDEADHAALERRAAELQIRPGTLARILVHSGLNQNTADLGASQALAALDRLVSRSQQRAPADALSSAPLGW
jgi:hypothetical protein